MITEHETENVTSEIDGGGGVLILDFTLSRSLSSERLASRSLTDSVREAKTADGSGKRSSSSMATVESVSVSDPFPLANRLVTGGSAASLARWRRAES